MEPTDKIIIRGLEFYGYHGASDQEQTVGHRYLLNVELFVDASGAAATDRLSDTVSYSKVARRLVEMGTQRQFRLIEALAGHMAQSVLDEFAAVSAIRIQLYKMCPPMNAIVGSVGIDITRSRI